jgi:hypothetical protein
MRSPADRLRLERVLRVVAILALAGWVANALRPTARRHDVASEGSLPQALARWTRSERVDSVHVELDTVPDAAHTAWLAALRGAGVGVSWAGPGIPALALEAYAAAEPAGGTIVLASAPARVSSILSDELGPLDTLRSKGAPTASRVPMAEGRLVLTSGGQGARAYAEPGSVPRRVFVAGTAGWESKFVVAALEERGWRVDARLTLGPNDVVKQGPAAQLDTARYAAVVLLDSAAAETIRGVEQFAKGGGGVVLAGDASAARRVAALVAWRPLKREAAPIGTLPTDSAWRGLSRVPFDTVAGRRALALERRSGRLLVAARRYYAGRVLGVGYDQTWRWRMMGGEEGPTQHGTWWSRLVASVANRALTNGDNLSSGAAPLAALHQALGPASAPVRVLPTGLSSSALSTILGSLVLGALLSEWLLRRSRGLR